MKDFPVSLIKTVTARNKTSERSFLNNVTELKNVNTFLHAVCPKACIAYILGFVFFFLDPAGLKP